MNSSIKLLKKNTYSTLNKHSSNRINIRFFSDHQSLMKRLMIELKMRGSLNTSSKPSIKKNIMEGIFEEVLNVNTSEILRNTEVQNLLENLSNIPQIAENPEMLLALGFGSLISLNNLSSYIDETTEIFSEVQVEVEVEDENEGVRESKSYEPEVPAPRFLSETDKIRKNPKILSKIIGFETLHRTLAKDVDTMNKCKKVIAVNFDKNTEKKPCNINLLRDIDFMRLCYSDIKNLNMSDFMIKNQNIYFYRVNISAVYLRVFTQNYIPRDMRVKREQERDNPKKKK
jgi:hypothetical protein